MPVKRLCLSSLYDQYACRAPATLSTPAAASPSKIYRHRWAAHDVVVTDNYAALHTAAPGKQFNSEPRLIQRVCVPGGHVPESVL